MSRQHDAPDTEGDTLAVYSDYVCPFCYLGRASLREYEERADDPPEEIEWRFFDLRGYKRGPDGEIRDEVDDGKDEDYFEQVRENVARLTEEYGVEMLGIDEVPDTDSWDAQQLALYVRQQYGEAAFEALHHRLFDAYWVEGRDIGDPDVLADVAGDELDIDESEVREALADDELESKLRDRFDRAQEAGITGIPTFVYEGHAARGAVPPAQLRRLVEGV